MLLLMRWLHLSGAIAAVGGLLFLVAALLPALRQADPEQAFLLMRDLLRRVRTLVWASLGVLLLSGVYAAGADRPPAGPAYAVAFGIKTILSVLFVIVAAVGVLPPARPEGLRRRADWLWLGLLLGTAVVFLSAYLRQLRLAA